VGEKKKKRSKKQCESLKQKKKKTQKLHRVSQRGGAGADARSSRRVRMLGTRGSRRFLAAIETPLQKEKRRQEMKLLMTRQFQNFLFREHGFVVARVRMKEHMEKRKKKKKKKKKKKEKSKEEEDSEEFLFGSTLASLQACERTKFLSI
jgi:hypothetical protein